MSLPLVIVLGGLVLALLAQVAAGRPAALRARQWVTPVLVVGLLAIELYAMGPPGDVPWRRARLLLLAGALMDGLASDLRLAWRARRDRAPVA